MDSQEKSFEDRVEHLERLVDSCIYTNDFDRAVVAEHDLIKLLEQEGSKPAFEVLRLFRLYFSMQNYREATTAAIKGIRYVLESGNYIDIVVSYSYLVGLGTLFYREKELTAYCYELCLSTLLYKEKKSELSELLTTLVKQVPYFARCTQYEKLMTRQFHLLTVEDSSYNQDLLVPLIAERYKQ